MIGIISEVLPVFARKPIFGYKAIVAAMTALVASTAAIVFLSMIVWGRETSSVGLPVSLRVLSVLAALVVAVPFGIIVFSWLATLWRGSVRFDSAMLYALGFLVIFVTGLITGIYLAALPIDSEVRNSYFAVAQFHYAVVGSTLFAVFAGLFYWWPKMFGRRLSERLGKWQFWFLLIGFNVAFIMQFIVGHKGMPRGIDTYSDESWEGYNLASTVALLRHGDRDHLLRRQRLADDRSRRSRRQRPVAGGYPRVVHDLPSAPARFRRGAVRDQREAPERPPEEAA